MKRATSPKSPCQSSRRRRRRLPNRLLLRFNLLSLESTPMARVIVGMSGGVDSSVTAALLKQDGYDVIGVTLNVWPDLPNMPEIQREDACCALGAVEDARRVADKLDIPYYVLNFREVFEEKVIKDFVQTY